MAEELTADDHLAVRDTIARYAWALDTGDVEGFVECFCRDGVLVWDACVEPERWQGAEAQRHFAAFPPDVVFEVFAHDDAGVVSSARYLVPHSFDVSPPR